MSRKRGRKRLPRRRTYQPFDPAKEGTMSIKSDVLEHLITHPNEVVSLTALASKLDITLDQVRSAISSLRNGAKGGEGATDEKVAMREQIRVVSKGYAVKFVPAAVEKTAPTPADMPTLRVVSSTPNSAEPVSGIASDATGAADVTVTDRASADVFLDKLEVGPITRKVLHVLIDHGGKPVRSDEIIRVTGLTRAQVYGALYSTLTSTIQRNPEAMRYFEKTAHGQYRYVADGTARSVDETGLIGPSPYKKKNAAINRTTTKTPSANGRVGATVQKRLFEELRALPDGSILIEDENGNVFKAREV